MLKGAKKCELCGEEIVDVKTDDGVQEIEIGTLTIEDMRVMTSGGMPIYREYDHTIHDCQS